MWSRSQSKLSWIARCRSPNVSSASIWKRRHMRGSISNSDTSNSKYAGMAAILPEQSHGVASPLPPSPSTARCLTGHCRRLQAGIGSVRAAVAHRQRVGYRH